MTHLRIKSTRPGPAHSSPRAGKGVALTPHYGIEFVDRATAVGEAPVGEAMRRPPESGIGFVDRAGTIAQGKLRVGPPGDRFEREADVIADRIMRMPSQAGPGHAPSGHTAQRKCEACESGERVTAQRKCEACEAEERATAQREPLPAASIGETVDRPSGRGEPMDPGTRAFFEPRFARDLSAVRVHTGPEAARAARTLNARAFTVGRDLVFGAGEYRPRTPAGRRLIAHELTHTIQQGGGGSTGAGPISGLDGRVQRKLASPRFASEPTLVKVEAGTAVLKSGSKDRAVLLVQHALYDIGYSLPDYGADQDYGSETKAAVKKFQNDESLTDSGEVNDKTIKALDAKFATPTLPSSKDRNAPWTETCVLGILCPWSPHTVATLKTITLKSFDSIQWDDEEWDGSKWIPAPFPGAGYQDSGEIGLENDTCESVAETLYHETLHTNQPATQKTMFDKEFYAYRIGEEFSIAMGLTGQSSLRSSSGDQADTTKVGDFVKDEYPSVSSSGASSEQIIDKGTKLGDVKVQKGSTISERPAVKGDKVPGPITLTNEKTHDTSKWKC